MLTVEDDGIGIPAESLDKVFHRFFQENRDASREMGGTGLGLSISYGIVTDHGGQLEALSAEGEGTTFTITLPAEKEPETEA